MQKKIFPIILTAALLVSSLVSLFFIHNLQGNAKVINYAGVVRGATQRLIKQELNHLPNDADRRYPGGTADRAWGAWTYAPG